MPSFTVDTNILIYHLQGEYEVHETLEQWLFKGNHVFISAITRLELLAAPPSKSSENEKIYQLLRHFVLIPVGAQIADAAAQIRRKHRLHLGDSIIAATALLVNSTLATRNLRDFKKVVGLNILSI